MLGRFFKEKRERKAREQHERELKQRLAEKCARYTQLHGNDSTQTDVTQEITDYTEVMIQGKPTRVAKENITIHDLDEEKNKK
jgi:cytidylate kinase